MKARRPMSAAVRCGAVRVPPVSCLVLLCNAPGPTERRLASRAARGGAGRPGTRRVAASKHSPPLEPSHAVPHRAAERMLFNLEISSSLVANTSSARARYLN